MDNNYSKLIEMITGEVLKEINRKAQVNTTSHSPQTPSGTPVEVPVFNADRSKQIDSRSLASYIDHTLLKPDASEEMVVKLCREAMEFGFFSVCVNPIWVSTAAKLLKNSDVKVCTVVGFPLGATPSDVKAYETKRAIEDGADEIDMVLNIGYMKSKKLDEVLSDIRKVKEACGNTLLKVILETCLLTSEEKMKSIELCKRAGADYVKTSTGFSGGGATAEDIALMRRIVGDALGVKASGGVRDYEGALNMVNAGASRIGASASVAIVQGQYDHSGY